MSGNGHQSSLITASSSNLINGILGHAKWDDTVLNYSWPASNVNYFSTGFYWDETDTFSQIGTNLQTAAHFALSSDMGPPGSLGFSVGGFTNLTITLDNDPSSYAHIRLGNTDTNTTTAPNPPAWTYTVGEIEMSGDVWFYQDFSTAEAGNFYWRSAIHEMGHALGLSHGHDSQSHGKLPNAKDSMEYSVMTYKSYVGSTPGSYNNEEWSFPQTWMMADIAALQYLYGADYTTNSGDTIYKWLPDSGKTYVNGQVAINPGGNRIFATIWDGGGEDTYDLSAYFEDLKISLLAGGHSSFGFTQRADLGDGNIARGNIFNALLYKTNWESLIENAIGGHGNDVIKGNQTKNILRGGDGKDLLKGLGGNDKLYGEGGADKLIGGFLKDKLFGGEGNDRLFGQSGKDELKGGGDDDKLFGGSNADILWGGGGKDRIDGGKGNDILFGGPGRDKFVFADGKDHDVIMDFQNGKDKLDLKAFGFGSKAAAMAYFYELGSSGDGLIGFAIDGKSIEIHGLNLGDINNNDLII